MHGCVVDQKLSYSYMRVLMLVCLGHGVNACMHVAHVFQDLNI